MSYVQGVHIVAAIPFGELVLLLMLTPNVKLSRGTVGRYLFGGYLIGGFTLLFVVLRDIAALGNLLELFTLPGFVTLRLVNLGMALSRMEILFEIVLIVLLFFKITLLYYVSVTAVAQLFHVRRYRRLVLAAGALIVVYGSTLYPDSVAHILSAQQTVPVIFTLPELLIPLLTLIIAKFRGLPKSGEVE
jgi:spore germination protein KB